MKDFDTICKENGLEYFIGGGTALGALRNEGFLAWDDDVDLFVTYDTHLKLNEVMKNINMPDRQWVAEEVTPYFWNPIARFYDLTTTDIVKDKINDGTPSGHCLEIFTMDPYPNTEEEQKNYHKYLWLYTEIDNPRFLSANLSMPEEMIDKDLYHYYRDMVEKEGHDAAMADIVRHMTYPDEECDYYCARWSYRPLIFRKEWVRETRPITLEDYEFPAARGIIRQMISNYNSDWNIVPRPKERQTHASLENTRMSYREHEEEVKKLCDEADFNTLLHTNKADRVERVFSQFDLQKEIAGVRYAYMCALAESLGRKKWTYNDDERSSIGSDLSEYLKLCFIKSYKKFKFSVPMNDDLRDTIFYYLIYSNRRDDARYFTELYRDCAKYDDYCRINYCLAEMKIARYENDAERTAGFIKELTDKWGLGGQLEVERALMWHVTRTRESFTDEEINELRENLRNPSDREIGKYFGDIALKRGEIQRAHELFKKMYPSRNGILITEAQQLGFYEGTTVSDNTLKLLELLLEFDNICSRTGISYIVAGPVINVVTGGEFKNFDEIQVFMRPKDMLKFLRYTEENASGDREVEYYGNNPDYPAFSLRYIDRTTTSFNASTPDLYKKDGMCIEILPVRDKKPERTSVGYLIEKVQLKNDRYTRSYIAHDYSGVKRFLLSSFEGYLKLKGYEGRRRFFERLCNTYDEGREQYWVLNRKVHFMKMPERFFKDVKRVTLLGKYPITIPARTKEYTSFLDDFYIFMGYESDKIVDDSLSYSAVVSHITNTEEIKAIIEGTVTDFDKLKYKVDERTETVDTVFEEIEDLYNDSTEG